MSSEKKKRRLGAKNTREQRPFRAVSSLYDFRSPNSDIVGDHEVWYLKSKEDLRQALEMSRSFATRVRSGRQSRSAAVDGRESVVLDLSNLREVVVDDDFVTVEPGARCGDVMRELAEHGLVLPLSSEPERSISSNVLDEKPSAFLRSLGPLTKYTEVIEGFEENGRAVSFESDDELSSWDRCRGSNPVISEFRFSRVSASSMWMHSVSLVYPGKEEFFSLSRRLFDADKLPPSQTDLILDAYKGGYEMPMVAVITHGMSPEDAEVALAHLNTALKDLEALYTLERETVKGAEVLVRLSTFGPRPAADPTIRSVPHRRRVGRDANWLGYLREYSRFVDEDLGKFEGPSDWNLFSRLQLGQNDNLEQSGYMYTTRSDEERARKREVTPAVDRRSAPLRRPARFSIFSNEPGPIEDFEGEILQQGDSGYSEAVLQYGTFMQAQKSPFMVAYPTSEADVMKAIDFARDIGKRVVARSGGHSYSAKSIGGPDTIVLSLENLNRIQVSGRMLMVGPGVKLTDLAREVRGSRLLGNEKPGLTIPHGECPYVCIGGHAQTGGYGHLLRGFGLTLDHLRAFDIVLADGTKRTATRAPRGREPSKESEELFWAVLGGNAGSFGVVTNYRFECIDDRNHPKSYGYALKRLYNRDAYFQLMKQVQRWTREKNRPDDHDLMITVASADGFWRPFAPMLVELVHSNRGGADQQVDGPVEFASVIAAAEHNLGFHLVTKGDRFLSHLSESFVRRFPGTTHEGREYDYPFLKRVNSTSEPLTDEFVTAFVNLVDETISTSGVKVVFQMLIGGGMYAKSPYRKATSIPHRDYAFCFVYDLFFKTGHRDVARKLQERMQQLVDTHFTPDQEQRAFWGSFGNTDITNDNVLKMYYDNPKVYAKLQKLKAKFDQDDVFGTDFTVKLPSE